MDSSATGYVLVSQTHTEIPRSCGKQGCYVKGQWNMCPMPGESGSSALCVPSRSNLLDGEFEAAWRAWHAAHHTERPTGGTRLGPLHYFRDCHTLLKRGPRRKDARIVGIDARFATDLNLPVCKECAAKMAPYEKQFGAEREAARR